MPHFVSARYNLLEAVEGKGAMLRPRLDQTNGITAVACILATAGSFLAHDWSRG